MYVCVREFFKLKICSPMFLSCAEVRVGLVGGGEGGSEEERQLTFVVTRDGNVTLDREVSLFLSTSDGSATGITWSICTPHVSILLHMFIPRILKHCLSVVQFYLHMYKHCSMYIDILKVRTQQSL